MLFIILKDPEIGLKLAVWGIDINVFGCTEEMHNMSSLTGENEANKNELLSKSFYEIKLLVATIGSILKFEPK